MNMYLKELKLNPNQFQTQSKQLYQQLPKQFYSQTIYNVNQYFPMTFTT